MDNAGMELAVGNTRKALALFEAQFGPIDNWNKVSEEGGIQAYQ
jgi:hypothetical protein